MKCHSPTHPQKPWTFEVWNIMSPVSGSPQGKAGSLGSLDNGILPFSLWPRSSASPGQLKSLPRSSQEQRMRKKPAGATPRANTMQPFLAARQLHSHRFRIEVIKYVPPRWSLFECPGPLQEPGVQRPFLGAPGVLGLRVYYFWVWGSRKAPHGSQGQGTCPSSSV